MNPKFPGMHFLIIVVTLLSIKSAQSTEQELPQLQALPQLNPAVDQKKKIVRKKKDSSYWWEYRLSITPSIEYIGGDPEQAKRAATKGFFNYVYGPFRFYTEGFVEVDEGETAELRKSEQTSALQEVYLEYKFSSFSIKAGTQALRWSEAWTLPSLDGWTARRFNRFFFDPLSEQLIHPTGVLFNWNTSDASAEFFQNFRPAVSILPEPIPETKSEWKNEWGARIKYRFPLGIDADASYFELTDKKLYGGSINYATEYLVPKVEVGQDSLDNQFTILGLDFFYEQFSVIPRATFYKTRPIIQLVDQDPQSGTNYHLTLRWDNNSTWAEVQNFQDSIMKAKFYSLRLGHRLGKGFEASGFVQNYAGADNTLFGLYESITGGTIFGTKLAVTF